MTKDEVIAGSLWQVTVYAAFQRAKVYSESVTDEQKIGVKRTLENEIVSKLPIYIQTVTEEDHVKNIVSIAENIDTKWGDALHKNSIPVVNGHLN